MNKKEMNEKKYSRSTFTLDECKASINIIASSKDRGYGTAFLNIQLPDGRWATFQIAEGTRVPLYQRGRKNE